MRILNLYAGLGGNRKHWDGHDITAVELDENIARVYADQYPQDNLVICDAHQYLLDHYDEYDFIWSSPPCQSHSKMVKATRHDIRKYPDIGMLYGEILFLQHFAGDMKWVVENVKPYYKPLVDGISIGRHVFWANFPVRGIEIFSPPNFISSSSPKAVQDLKDWLGIQYEGNLYYGDNHCPAQVLRNCVHPDIGSQILECAKKETGQIGMFNNGK